MQERRNDAATRDSGSNISDGKRKEDAKLLWRDFQFAFRVYTFASGLEETREQTILFVIQFYFTLLLGCTFRSNEVIWSNLKSQ